MRTNKARLGVERLDAREVPACIVTHPAPDTVAIVGDNANDTVLIRDNGAGVISGSATGAGVFAFAGIKNIRVATNGGDDRVSYTLYANMLGTQQRNVSVDLGASTWSGSNQFVANLYNPATGIGSDLLARSSLALNVFGGSGRDVIFVNAFRDTDVAFGARLSMNLFGQAGNDIIQVNWHGENDGQMSLYADGGAGNDLIRGYFREDPGSTGVSSGQVRGGDGNDNLGLFMWTQNPPAIAVLDGGAGIDFGIGTANVAKINFP